MKRFLLVLMLAFPVACGKETPAPSVPDSPQTPPETEDTRITVKIATYNIRCLNSADIDYKSWEFRKGNVAKMVKDRGFEIVGF